MTQVTQKVGLDPTIRGNAMTRDGITVQIIAEGPGVGWLERKVTQRNHRRWQAGKRPNKFGIWR